MGRNINEIYQANILLNATYITYSVLSKFPIPNVIPVQLVSNLIIISKWGTLLWEVNDQDYLNSTPQGLVSIQKWYRYCTIENIVTRVLEYFWQ